MMERPTGLPLGAATQSTGRPLGDNGLPRPPPLNTARRIPNMMMRHESSNPALSAQNSITPAEVVALAREAMRNALEENQTKAAEASGVSNELKPGVTIDLSHKYIQKFPEEVVDIIKNELERLALSHNQISTFPSRFSECVSLRYLNVRNNFIREFPQSICQLTSLEILDLGRNKLKVLPPELVRLTSLKVLSVQKNRIEALPLCLADMASLQVLKLDGNPINFPPPEILEPQATTPPNGRLNENENENFTVTLQIKKFLKTKALTDRSETESGGEESSEGTETPRPMKRVMSGRFPIKVNGTDVPDLRSPAFPRPPPIPSRSHYRGLSQQNPGLRRPDVMPLTINGNNNERVRSNSEGLLQAARPSDRSRRMGIVSKKASELTTVDESKTNRYSHYRGLSHGSAMSGTNGVNGNGNTRSPASPADSGQRATYVRRLSSLPERKRESSSPDPVIEGAKGILYALFQVHPLIQNLLGVTRDGTNKRTSLERVFYNANVHVEELDRDIQRYITYSEEDEEAAPRSNENVHRACLASVQAYIQVLGLLSNNIETLLDNGDPRYIRTLLLLIYGSAAEVRNAGADLFKHGHSHRSRISEEIEIQETLRFPTRDTRDKSVTPTRERPGISLRSRSATAIHTAGNLRIATNGQAPPALLSSANRSVTMTSATPRSGESFSSSTNGDRRIEFSEEDKYFEKIYLRLMDSADMAINALPRVNGYFVSGKNSNQRPNETPPQFWNSLIQKCALAHQTAENLRARLSIIQVKEPGVRTQSAFWELCSAFVYTYTDLVVRVKEAKASTNLLPMEVIHILRPLQKAIKETSQLIQNSPWSFLAGPQSATGLTNGAYNSRSPASQVPLPMTPQSAALGPAVQATVPSTPQSAYSMSRGDFYQRADAFLAMNGGSVASSRTGTMTSTMNSNSSSSTLNTNDGMMTPASIMSPMNSFGSMSSRYNSNEKLAF